MANKKELRQVYLEKRLFLSPQELDRRNKLILEQSLNFLSNTRFKVIHTFLPIENKKEVDTRPIISTLRKSDKEWHFFVSKTLPQGKLEHFELEESSTIVKNKWGIPEPVNAKQADMTKLEVVFVPLITFDRKGQRIGYGKGYYDRFLTDFPNTLKVGLTLGPPLDIIPYNEPTDVAMDYCITPFEIYKF